MTRQIVTLCLLALAAAAGMHAQDVEDGIETVQFNVLLSPSHEVEPLPDLDASGETIIEFILTREDGEITSALVDFRIEWRAGQMEEMRAAHIHRGPAGVNGPVVINTGLSPIPMAQGGTIFRTAEVTDADMIAVVEEILADPGAFYFNVHSASNPGGIIRGQLQPDLASQVAAAQANLAAAISEVNRLVRIVGRLGNAQ